MSENQETLKIPLPKGWKKHVRSAVLHVISLALYSAKGVSTSLYHLPYLVVAFALPADELTIGDRINCHGVLEESVEQEATSSRTPSVETERVFIEVVVHMLLAHSPLVGSK